MNDIRIVRAKETSGATSVALVALGMSRQGQRPGRRRILRVRRQFVGVLAVVLSATGAGAQTAGDSSSNVGRR